ncbi:hypothetical protein [Corynebacterium sputi]|uniref:hypothetical protein n=1 Tax=Corynebacterium sputi TaxID=489915 RepID=UPI0012EBADCB
MATTTAVEAETLKEVAGISDSALSKHLRRLADVGYISQTLGRSRGPGRPESGSLSRSAATPPTAGT